MELLWACAYGYVVVFDEVYASKAALPGQVVDLRNQPSHVREALELLRWSLQSCVENGIGTFPVALLPPRTPRKLGSHAAVADELCLCAVGFILHHEFAHHRLDHQAGGEIDSAWSIDQEKEADAAAVEWILDEISVDSLFFTKRAIGAAIALLLMTARMLYAGEGARQTHPRAFDRLFNLLESHAGTSPNHAVWVFATVALKLHLDNSHIALPAKEFSTFRECFDHYIDLIAEQSESEVPS